MDDFHEKTAAFLEWFKALPGSTVHPDIQLADLRHRTAGRVATRDIPEDTVLFSVPRSSVLTTETSSLAEKLPGVFERLAESTEDELHNGEEPAANSSSWLALILVLMYEKLHQAESRWRPYLELLPQTFDTLMFWSDEQLAELQASNVIEKVGKEEATVLFASTVLPIIRANGAVFFSASSQAPTDDELLDLAHKTGSTIMAYAFDLEKDDSDDEDEEEPDEDGWVEDKHAVMKLGMVPFADMLNADAEFNAIIDHDEAALAMTSVRAITAGEEILNYYGPLPSSDLLRRYGYYSPKHARYDAVEIPYLSLLTSMRIVLDKSREQVTTAIAEAGIDADELHDSFLLDRAHEAGPDDSGTLKAEVTPAVIPPDAKEVVRNILSHLLDDPALVKKTVYSVFQHTFDAHLALYSTSIEQDVAYLEAIVAKHPSEGETARRTRMAIEVRLGEKRLLREASLLAGVLGEKAADAIQPPAAKRQRRA